MADKPDLSERPPEVCEDLAKLRNGIEEADGSISFSSTKFLGFIFPTGSLKRLAVESP
jgi:hypothetical protein